MNTCISRASLYVADLMHERISSTEEKCLPSKKTVLYLKTYSMQLQKNWKTINTTGMYSIRKTCLIALDDLGRMINENPVPNWI